MENHQLLISLASVIVFGAAAQWIAWKLHLPSILLLLASGFLAGPVAHLVEPDQMLGELLFPFVSLCVAIILFEGALSLRFSELHQIGAALGYLLTVGVLVTWSLTAICARTILGMEWFTAILLGAILVVTGPTVIGPLLRQIRPIGAVGPIARWEGIVIDPLGAVLAVLVFNTQHILVTDGYETGSWVAFQSLCLTLVYGGGFGAAAAFGLTTALKRHAVPDHLENIVTLLFVVVSFVAANTLQEESGLLAVTVMGIVMANSNVSLKHIIEFKESLSLLLISGLFILLAARVDMSAVTELGWRGMGFVAVMILLVRPISVFVATAFTPLHWKERLLLSWLAPRGIVAAAVASIFALELGSAGQGLVPATFLLIVVTVVVYGLTAFPLARALGLASSNPQGVLIIGADEVGREVGHAVQQAGYPVLMVDTNRWHVRTARLEGLRATHANVLEEYAADELDLGGIGRLLALTSNDEINSLGAMHFAELFGRANVFQLTPWREAEKKQSAPRHLRARFLFDQELTHERFRVRLSQGSRIKVTKLTPEFGYDDFRDRNGEEIVPLFVSQGHRLTICSSETTDRAQAGADVNCPCRRGRVHTESS